MNGWQATTLGSAITLQRGHDLPERVRRPGNVAVIGSAGPNGWHDTPKAPGPGVTVGRSGASAGVVTYVAEPYWPHNTVLYVTDFKGNDPRFVAYLLSTLPLAELNSGAAQPSLNRNFLYPLPVLIPSADKQRRIASILGAYDDLIEVNRRRIALLEEMARRLFSEWFVCFRFPGHEIHEVIETPDGPVPAGWRRGVLGDLIELAYGKALKADQRIAGCIPVVGSSGVVGWHDARLVGGPGIVLGRKGNVGAVIWCPTDFYPIDTVFFVKTPQPLRYILELLRRLSFQNTDAAVPGLNRGAALHVPVLIPPVDLTVRYDEFAAPLLDLGEALRKANHGLTDARDLLLPRLVSGDLSVAVAEREL